MLPIIPLLLTLLLAGCAGTSPPTRFYLLDSGPLPAEARRLAVRPGLSIGLGPIGLPDLLDRPQIVARTQAHSVVLSEFHQWAGTLTSDMGRLMARQLMDQLSTSKVALYPWPRERELDYQIRVDVFRFDGQLGGEVRLNGTWSLIDGQGREEVATEAFALTDTTAGPGHDDLVVSLSRLTGRLTDIIARGIADRETQ